MFRTRWGAILAGLLVLQGTLGAATEHRVGQKNKTFSVALLSIKPGDRVTFDNDDDATHSVYSADKSADAFNLKRQEPGSSVSLTFNTLGSYEVRCAYHAKMKLLIIVKH